MVALAVLLVTGCLSGQLFKIASRVEVAPAELCCRASVADITVAAEPLTDEDQVLATFGGNALLAGVLPVRVWLENRATGPVELRRADFDLYDAQGKRLKELAPKKALERLVDYYGIRVRQEGSFERTLRDLQDLALARESALGAGEARQGFVFFEFEPESATPTNLKLVLKDLRLTQTKQKLELNLPLN